MAHPMYEAVQRIVSEDPFRPFVIIMDNDEQVEITHREFVIPMKGWDLILVQRPEDHEARMLSPEHMRELTRSGARAA
jgi:hypothetical protein